MLRDRSNPFQNMNKFRGMSGERIEQVEERIREELVLESKKYKGLFLLHGERKGELVGEWERIDSSTLKTPKQVFNESGERSKTVVKYLRIPISPLLPSSPLPLHLLSTLLPSSFSSKDALIVTLNFILNNLFLSLNFISQLMVSIN